jgi:Protein of unknown function (DUF2642)
MQRDGFVEFLDEARAEEAARSRARERWLRQQTAEEARFAGTLVDLLERGAPLSVRTTMGRVHHGTLVAVGRNFCLLRTASEAETYVALDAIVWVRPSAAARAPAATGDRCGVSLDLTLNELCNHLAADRPRVRVTVHRDAEPIAGQLRAVGVDVLTLRLDGEACGTCFVPTTAVAEVVIVRE